MGEPQFLRTTRPERRNARWGHPLAYIIEELPRAIEGAIDRLAIPEEATVLDFGCAEQPYRASLPADVRYLGADLPGNPLAELTIRPGEPLDLAAGSADVVLSSQVLEHVVDPAGYLRECHRVLAPDGHLLLSTHGLMPLHRDPIDYWRWTCDGLRHVLAEAGFEVDAFEGVMGMAATGVQLFQDATIVRLPRRLWRPYAAILQGIARLADRRTSRESRAQNAMVYLVTATPVSS